MEIDWPTIKLRNAEMAQLLGVTPARISQLKAEEGAPIDDDGLWHLAQFLRWRDGRRAAQEGKEALLAEQIERARLHNAKLRQELVPLEEVKQAVLGAIDGVRAEFMSLPRRWTDDRGQQAAMLEDIRDALDRSASAITNWQPADSGSADADPAPEPERGPVGRPKARRRARQPRAGTVED